MYKIYIHKLWLIMRLTTVILIATFMQVSASTLAQKINLKQKYATLENVLREVHRQSGYDFFFDRKLIDNTFPISITLRDASLEDALKTIFNDLPLTYNIEGKIIIIKKQEGSFLTRINDYFNQTDIRGKITDDSGAALAGAYIRSFKNSRNYTVSGKDGEYSLRNLQEDDRLIVSYIGYKTDTIAINGRMRLEIILKRQTNEINEVNIISTGYQTLPKERATGAFGGVSAEKLEKFPVVSILERLRGLVPGVDISTKTTAGRSRSGTVNIRGISTLVSSYTKVSTDPLLVIDGFPSQQSITNGAFDFINPDDIEQITFLKDAAASSIWGIQAANGVIVITTKKGSMRSQPSINFSATLGTSKRPKATYGPLMSMTNYIALEKELIDKKILSDPTLVTSGFYPPNGSQAQNIIFSAVRKEITETQRDEQLAALAQNDNSDQVSELLLQPPTTRQYNLSISGGGESNSYFISGYLYDEDRAYKNNTNKGYSLKASNVSKLIGGRLTVTSDLTIGNTRDKINNAAVRAMSITEGGLRPYDMLVNSNGDRTYYDVLLTSKLSRNLESKGFLPFRYSPVEELDYSNTLNTSTNLNLNLNVNGKITSWLDAIVSGNVARNFSENETYNEPDSYEARMMINKASSLNGTGNRVVGIPIGGKLDLGNSLGRSYSIRGQIDAHKSWENKHQVNLIVGTEIREQFEKSSAESRYGYDKAINAFRIVNPFQNYTDIFGQSQTLGATSKPVVERTTRGLSQYANAAYTFDGKYTVSGSARFDDYNLLGVDRRKRAIPLWSSGLKWNIKNESLVKNIDWIDQLSVRATYGFSGNAPKGYAPVAVVSLLGNDFYTGYPYALIASPAIDNLGWEKTRMINYGLDFSLFKNRFSASVDYYRKHTTDIIWQMPINSTYGYNTTLFNTANLDGDGVDLGVNFVPIASSNFKWSSTLNISYNTNVIRDVRFKTPTGSFSPENLYDGYPRDYLFSFSWAGLDATGQSVINDPNIPGKTYSVLEYPFLDIRKYSGRTTSPWYGSFGHSFQYKDFDLNFQFLYNLGGVFRKPSVVSIGFGNNINVGRSGDLDKRWQKPGDEKDVNVPGLVFGPNTSYFTSLARYTESDYLIQSRSVVRFQQLMLSYTIPQTILKKYGVKRLAVSAVARNLGMIWTANKEGLDPDYLYTTGNNYQLGPVPTFSFRTSLTL